MYPDDIPAMKRFGFIKKPQTLDFTKKSLNLRLFSLNGTSCEVSELLR